MGTGSDSMSDANQSGAIEMPPRVPEVQNDGVSQWMEWHADMPREITPKETQGLEGFLSREEICVSFSVSTGNHINVNVKQTPAGDYTELYDASLRSLFYLEKQVGELITIEGYPRSKWKIQFIFARRFGALE